jgi:hypothetical protein
VRQIFRLITLTDHLGALNGPVGSPVFGVVTARRFIPSIIVIPTFGSSDVPWRNLTPLSVWMNSSAPAAMPDAAIMWAAKLANSSPHVAIF